jgi:hypothetical protein
LGPPVEDPIPIIAGIPEITFLLEGAGIFTTGGDGAFLELIRSEIIRLS